MEFLIKTRGNSSPKGKPKVYFTSHPGDLEKYLHKLCEDIFKTHDCAIYYTEDMTAEIEEKYKETDLGSMNLFIVPVTKKLLTEQNRAMDHDIIYALNEHIPVLPFMMESGLDAVYSLPEKFGELQYINPFSNDTTEIGYGEKLKAHLESVLISKEEAEKIREAFDAYIFLSYRKKDRQYANQLMKLIHSNPEFCDIAVWYDEFLTPGESFKENIDKMLSASKLFLLLVTPNLLEEPNGKPNFVMAEEYPAARRSGMTILPAEMAETSHFRLKIKYKGIKGFIDPNDKELLSMKLSGALKNVKRKDHGNDHEHNYLMGLAYLEGIDVEKNRERAVSLITSAALSGNPKAMLKLYRMYENGDSVELNYNKATMWGEKVLEYCKNTFGQTDTNTLNALYNLATTYNAAGKYEEAAEMSEKLYNIRQKLLGEENRSTLSTLSVSFSSYMDMGNYKKAAEIAEKAYSLKLSTLGAEHPDTLNSLIDLSSSYNALGEYTKALEAAEKAYTPVRNLFGDEHPRTLILLNNLSVIYGNIGEAQRSLDIMEKIYDAFRKTCGEDHPDTLSSLNNIAWAYYKLGMHQKAVEVTEKVISKRSTVLGIEHPDTLSSMSDLAALCDVLGDHRKALDLREKVYYVTLKLYGEDNEKTIKAKAKLEKARLKAQ